MANRSVNQLTGPQVLAAFLLAVPIGWLLAMLQGFVLDPLWAAVGSPPAVEEPADATFIEVVSTNATFIVGLVAGVVATMVAVRLSLRMKETRSEGA